MAESDRIKTDYRLPDPVNPEGDLAEGEIRTPAGGSKVVSAGVTPTGGIPCGAATDRIIPDRSIPTSADNVELDYSTRGEAIARTVDLNEDDEGLGP
jgi:hypothetical protein